MILYMIEDRNENGPEIVQVREPVPVFSNKSLDSRLPNLAAG
jgi:hypothetical protein